MSAPSVEVRIYQGASDGTTRPPWHAQADVRPNGRLDKDSVRGKGTGKKARVAASRAIDAALGGIRGGG